MSAGPAPPLVALQDASIAFGAHLVLRGIALEIPKGQTVAVIGESGCGKTVLLKLLIGLIKPTAGRVVFDGKVLADLNDRELTQQRQYEEQQADIAKQQEFIRRFGAGQRSKEKPRLNMAVV